MPFNPSGIFERLYSWVTDRDNGVKILAQRMDEETNGIVQAINQLTAGTVGFRGPVRTTTGTSATPAFSFKDDPNTGVYRAAEDVLGLTGGAGDLRVGATTLTYNGNRIYHAGAKPAAADVTGLGPLATATTAPIANGGTGATTVAGARTALGLGAAALDNVVPVAKGGTGATTAAAARTALGLADTVSASDAQSISGAKTFTAPVTMNAPANSLTSIIVATQAGVNRLVHWITAAGDYEMRTANNAVLRIIAGFGGRLNVGGGEVILEKHASDGSGTGVCIRATENPTGNGMIFSVRSNGGALGLGVQQDKLSSGRAEMYLGSDDAGAGGNRVLHSGIAANAVGQYLFGTQATGSNIANGGNVSGANLVPAADGADSGAAVGGGTYQARGFGRSGSGTVWQRIF